jgi:hypothetical protein
MMGGLALILVGSWLAADGRLRLRRAPELAAVEAVPAQRAA